MKRILSMMSHKENPLYEFSKNDIYHFELNKDYEYKSKVETTDSFVNKFMNEKWPELLKVKDDWVMMGPDAFVNPDIPGRIDRELEKESKKVKKITFQELLINKSKFNIYLYYENETHSFNLSEFFDLSEFNNENHYFLVKVSI